MPKFQPRLWLVSDARNDAVLDRALARLPRGSGLVFRHGHLQPYARRARFAVLRRLCRRYEHVIAWAGSAAEARAAGADACYGSSRLLARGPALPRLVTAHSLRELRQAKRADAVLLSPAFPTRSHPGAPALGPLRFRTLARHASVPVIALGGMNPRTARRLRWPAWAAIDGLS